MNDERSLDWMRFRNEGNGNLWQLDQIKFFLPVVRPSLRTTGAVFADGTRVRRGSLNVGSGAHDCLKNGGCRL